MYPEEGVRRGSGERAERLRIASRELLDLLIYRRDRLLEHAAMGGDDGTAEFCRSSRARQFKRAPPLKCSALRVGQRRPEGPSA